MALVVARRLEVAGPPTSRRADDEPCCRHAVPGDVGEECAHGRRFGDNPVIKMFGVGLSVAVLLDATVVRMVIVPAAISLFGETRGGSHVGSIGYPNVDIEGERLSLTSPSSTHVEPP